MTGLLPVSALLTTDAEISSGGGREQHQSNCQGADDKERPSYILPPLDGFRDDKIPHHPVKPSGSNTAETTPFDIGDNSDLYDLTEQKGHPCHLPRHQGSIPINGVASSYHSPDLVGHAINSVASETRRRIGAAGARDPPRLVLDTKVDGYTPWAPHHSDRTDTSPRGDSASASASSGVEGGRSASSSAGSCTLRQLSAGSRAAAGTEHKGNRRKRPRRAYEEIDRMYLCQWPGCSKSYGTLNHLNAHVALQGHGAKRTAAEFRDERRAWRARRKAEQIAKEHLALRSNGVGSDEERGRRDSSGSEKFKYTEQDMDTASRALLTMAGPRAKPPDALPSRRPPPEWSNSMADSYWRSRTGAQDAFSMEPVKERGAPHHRDGQHKFIPPQEALAQLSGQYNGTYPKGRALAPTPNHHHGSWRPSSSPRQDHHHQQQQQQQNGQQPDHHHHHHRHKGEWGPS